MERLCPERAVLTRTRDLIRTEAACAGIAGRVDGLHNQRIADVGEVFADGYNWFGNPGCGTRHGFGAFANN